MPYYLRHITAAVFLLASSTAVAAQSFEAVGTRAAGMGGAFVAIADDASAAYWNPAGFASGNVFTLVVDGGTSKSDPDLPQGAREGSGFLFAMGIPALGLSYYQVRSTGLIENGPTVRLDTLVTHHTGATLLQSIGDRLVVATTVKLVHGVASSSLAPDGARDALLEHAGELGGRSSTKVDADVGVMTVGPFFKVGLTIRNLTSPDFETPAGNTLSLSRQARAGIAFTVMNGWAVDADFDLTTTHETLGDVRQIATGTEARLGRKALIRGGLRVNTAGSDEVAAAAGGSYRIAGPLFVDGQITRGSDRASHGWGISARFVY